MGEGEGQQGEMNEGTQGDQSPNERDDNAVTGAAPSPVTASNTTRVLPDITRQDRAAKLEVNTITPITEDDFPDAVAVFRRGLAREVPPGDTETSDEFIKDLMTSSNCLVHKTDGKVNGLVTYMHDGTRMLINFITADVPGKGIGYSLMGHLAGVAKEQGIERIFSTVSTWDEKVMAFYKKCGFKEYDREPHGLADGKPFEVSKVSARPEAIRLALAIKGKI